MGKDPLEDGVAVRINTRVQNTVLACKLKNNRMISVRPRQIIQYHGNLSLCHDSNSEEAEVEHFYEDIQDLL